MVVMDLQTMLRDRRFQVAAAAVALVGVVAYARRSKTGSATTGSTAAGSATGTSAGGVATFDSTGTDVAHWLGDYSGSLQGQLDAYSKTLTDATAGLKAMGTAPEAPTTAEVKTWWDADQWLTDLQKNNPAATWDAIAALNPGFKSNVDSANRFKSQAYYAIPKAPTAA